MKVLSIDQIASLNFIGEVSVFGFQITEMLISIFVFFRSFSAPTHERFLFIGSRSDITVDIH